MLGTKMKFKVNQKRFVEQVIQILTLGTLLIF